MYALYSNMPNGLKLNNILHIVDPVMYPKLKNRILQNFIYTKMTVVKVGLTLIAPYVLKEYANIAVHDTPNRYKFWEALQKEPHLVDRIKTIVKANRGAYIGIGFGGEIIQDVSTEIKEHAGARVTALTKPLLGTLNKRILLNYKRTAISRHVLLDMSRQSEVWGFPPDTGYDSGLKTLIGDGIFLYRNGKEYYVIKNKEISDHKHDNKDVLDKLSEQDGRLIYEGMAPVVTWESVQW